MSLNTHGLERSQFGLPPRGHTSGLRAALLATTLDHPAEHDEHSLVPALRQLGAAVARAHPDLQSSLTELLIEIREDDRLPDAWALFDAPHAGRGPRIVLKPRTIEAGALQVAKSFIHELGHLLGHVRGEPHFSDGRHLGPFAVIAEELGLVVKPSAKHGYVTTGLGPIARARYAAEIAAITRALAPSPPSAIEILLDRLRAHQVATTSWRVEPREEP